MRWIAFLLLLACTACGGQQAAPPTPAPAALAAAPDICRIGPNDGPVLAERGIGGTGMGPFKTPLPAGETLPASPAGQDRGIGGTGAPPLGGGAKAATGIVGEITGFASVCLNGVEVAYDPATAIDIDGQAEPPAALRAGQIAAITAGPEGTGLRADVVAIRHEVAGPVSEVGPDRLTVAGQSVTWNDGTRGLRTLKPGDWIAVSGFRRNAGVIMATRIDPQPPGLVTVHGNIVKAAGGYWIGGLRLHIPPGWAPGWAPGRKKLKNGEAVTATGVLAGPALDVQTITPDLLYSDPQAYFGPQVKHILMQSYAYTLGGAVHIATGTSIGLLKGVLFYNESGPTILSLVRLPGGALQAVGQMLGVIGPGLSGGLSGGAPPP